MLLSVIVPTHNRAHLLVKMLTSVANQSFSHDQFEIIVVDDGSTDDTKSVVEEFAGKIKNIHYIYNERRGAHIARHEGLKKAQADILVYADDDIQVFPDWLTEINASMSDQEVVLVGGKNLPDFESSPPDWIVESWSIKKHYFNELGHVIGELSIIDLGDCIKEINPYCVFSCNFSIRKSIFLQAGGFHPDYMADKKYMGDGETYVSDFLFRRNLKALYNPGASVYHFIPSSRMTMNYFKARNFTQGIMDSYTMIRQDGKVRLDWRGSLKDLKYELLMLWNGDNFNCQLKKAYREGFKYHQHEARKDPALLKWILQDNYLD